jgi:hypothetical protein
MHEQRSLLAWLSALVVSLAYVGCAHAADTSASEANAPIALSPGPQLFLDDYLIARSQGVTRQVAQPKRLLKEPVVTSAPGHQNWQPWFSVHHDPRRPANKRFRIWYSADVNPDPADSAYLTKLAYLESADGVHWPGPFKQLEAEDVLWVTTVLDEGPDFPTRAERYKMLYWSLTTKRYGPMVAASPDGLTWKLKNAGKPVFLRQNSYDDSWQVTYDAPRKRYLLWGKRHVLNWWTNEEGQTLFKPVRTFGTSFSQDFEKFSDVKVIFTPDTKDPGSTEFYAVTGFHVRGDLTIGFVQLLRDDLRAEGAPDEAVFQNLGNPGSGMGYTALTWSRDGETWHRDRQKDAILSPDPKVGAWDHAMSWVSSVAPVDDEVYLYYAGYRWGHKFNRSTDRQIGLVKIARDRYVARHAPAAGGRITTPVVMLPEVGKLTLNADAVNGEVRVQVTDVAGQPLPGFSFADCRPITGDALEAPVEWKQPLVSLRDKPVRLEFSLRDASLYAFDLQK